MSNDTTTNSELRNRITGNVVKDEDDKPILMTQSMYISGDSDASNVYNDSQVSSDDEEQEFVQDESESETDTVSDTVSDVESESVVDDEEDEDENESDVENEEQEEEEEEEEEEDEDEDDGSKRFVVMDEGKPLVIIINNGKKEETTPGIIVFMLTLVCGLWLFNASCKLCSLMNYDNCLIRANDF